MSTSTARFIQSEVTTDEGSSDSDKNTISSRTKQMDSSSSSKKKKSGSNATSGSVKRNLIARPFSPSSVSKPSSATPKKHSKALPISSPTSASASSKAGKETRPLKKTGSSSSVGSRTPKASSSSSTTSKRNKQTTPQSAHATHGRRPKTPTPVSSRTTPKKLFSPTSSSSTKTGSKSAGGSLRKKKKKSDRGKVTSTFDLSSDNTSSRTAEEEKKSSKSGSIRSNGSHRSRGAIPSYKGSDAEEEEDDDDDEVVMSGQRSDGSLTRGASLRSIDTQSNTSYDSNNGVVFTTKGAPLVRYVSGLDIESPVHSPRASRRHDRNSRGSGTSIDPDGVLLHSIEDISGLSNSRSKSLVHILGEIEINQMSRANSTEDVSTPLDVHHRRSSTENASPVALIDRSSAGWKSNWLKSFEGGRLRHKTIPLKDLSHDLKKRLEIGVVKFNEKPNNGISYLVDEGLMEHTPDSIAQFLLTTDGLSKTRIGEFLGGGSQFCIDVMHSYVDHLCLAGLDFDSALRYFLSGFRLVGEAQKIDRMMEKFSNRYCEDNPNVFQHPDSAYILAFVLIMLNTDAHSNQVKNKMTKKQFCNNCRELLEQGLSKDYLCQAYDNIVKNEIKVEVDYLERLYARIQASDISPVQYGVQRRGLQTLYGNSSATLLSVGDMTSAGTDAVPLESKSCSSVALSVLPYSSLEDEDVLYRLNKLSGGNVFTKHGRRGKPHARKVWLSDDLEEIWYQDPEQKKRAKKIRCEAITDVYIGRDTTAVLRRSDIAAVKDALCFSIVTPSRTLDLEAENPDEVKTWVRFLTRAVEENLIRDEVAQQDRVRKVREREVIESLSEWRSFMFENWHLYSGEADPKLGSTFKRIWLKGIPPAIRGEAWPRAIGNELRISPELTDAFLFQAKLHWETFQVDPSKAFLGHRSSVEQLLADLPETFPELQFFHAEGPLLFKDTLRNILLTYMFYRPDVGYMHGMTHIAAMILLYTRFQDAFCTFANLLHSHYFLSFFRMDMTQVSWRLDFFESMFSRQMPELMKHFQHLNITHDSYLIDWCLTLYSKYLPLDTAAVVWDRYLLEGEPYIYRVALAILKLYQDRLLRSSYGDCMLLLTTTSSSFNHSAFLLAVESVEVDETEFFAQLKSNTDHLSGIRSIPFQRHQKSSKK